MQTKSVEQLRKELAEAKARESGLIRAPYIAVKWMDKVGGQIQRSLKRTQSGKYLSAYPGIGSVLISGFPDVGELEQIIEITADEFNAAYHAAMQKIKEAKDE